MNFPFIICTVAPNNRGSQIARRSTLNRAKKAAIQYVANGCTSPLGIWDSNKLEYVYATFLPVKHQ